MLQIEIKKKAIGNEYLKVNGIEDMSSKVTYLPTGEKAVARIRKAEIIEILSTSTFMEVGQYLFEYNVSHLYIRDLDAHTRLKVICSGDESGCIEIVLVINPNNWKKRFSVNELRNTFYKMVENGSGDFALLRAEKQLASSLLQFNFRFYLGDSNSVIKELTKIAIERFNYLVKEAIRKLDRRPQPIILSVPKELVVAIKQYLIFFPEYVDVVKGKTIKFEVKTTAHGISIETEVEDNIEELNEFFNEYIGYVKANIEELHPVFVSELHETERGLFVITLKQQVFHLRQQMELKSFKIQVLEREVERYYNLLITQNNKPLSPITINAMAKAESNVEMNMDIKQELPQLQMDILKLKSLLNEEVPESIRKEIEIIDNELIAAEPNDVEKIKKPLNRLKRIFNQLTDQDSPFNKTVQKSQKLKESLQTVGKTYNKIAQWLAMPVIPNVLLEI